ELETAYSVRVFLAILKVANYRSMALLRRLGFTPAGESQAAMLQPDPNETVMFKTSPPAHTRFLRHFLAALAYRTQKAVRDAPPSYADFRIAPNVRTPHELVWHMTGVIGYAANLFHGTPFTPERLDTFPAELKRFHATLEELGRLFESGELPEGTTAEQFLQGPLADAMTHAGQLAMLRRCAGSPVPPENFFLADIHTSNVGPEQAPPRAPKVGWRPDQPPPSPGRPLPGAPRTEPPEDDR
ncbi:hypothetical protein K8I85_13690, partial [bacterium]|nr:hypothetical protein [bacterium]